MKDERVHSKAQKNLKNIIFAVKLCIVCFTTSLSAQGPKLTDLEFALQDSTAGASTVATCSFKLDGTSLPNNNQIKLKFYEDQGFNFSKLFLTSPNYSSDLDGGLTLVTENNPIYIERDGTGTAVPDQGTVSFHIGMIRLPFVAGDYGVEISAETNAGWIKGNANANIVVKGHINSFDININTTTVNAGDPLSVWVTEALDDNSQPASGWVNINISDGFGISPNGSKPVLKPIYVQNGMSDATEQILVAAGEGIRLQGTSGLATDFSQEIDVVSADTDSFMATSFPDTVAAGIPFPDSVIIAAVDHFGNLKKSFDGQLVFSTDNPADELPASFLFDGNSGLAVFSGLHFIVQNFGTKHIYLKDNNLSPTIEGDFFVEVPNDQPFYTYSLDYPSIVTAGTPFQIRVSNFQDRNGPADGTVSLSFADGLPHSTDDGLNPVLNDITVRDGSGVSSNTLHRIENDVPIRATAPGAATETIQVDVGAIRVKDVTSAKTVVGAGQTGIEVLVDVENTGPYDFSITGADLYFEDAVWGTPWQDLQGRFFSVASNAVGQTVSANSSKTLRFTVAVDEAIEHKDVLVGAKVDGRYGGDFVTTHQSETFHSWTVFEAADLQVTNIQVAGDTLFQGQSSIDVTLTLSNEAGADESAAAVVPLDADFDPFLMYISDVDPNDTGVPPDSFQFTLKPLQEGRISAGDTVDLQYSLSIPGNAQLGTITLYADFQYVDQVSELNRTAGIFAGDNSNDEFLVEPKNIIKIESIESRATVTQGQTTPWTVRMAVKNTGRTPVSVDLDSSRSYIEFRQAQNLTQIDSGFVIDFPEFFEEGGITLDSLETRHLLYRIVQTSNDVGSKTIWGRIETTTGVSELSFDLGVSGTVEVLTSEELRFEDMWTSQPSITIGDESYLWQIFFSLANLGGSDVKIDMDSTHLIFPDLSNPENEFIVIDSLTTFTSADSILKPQDRDTVSFTLKSAFTANQPGIQRIQAGLGYTVLTTDERKQRTSVEDNVETLIDVQNPASIDIKNVYPSQNPVTAGVTSNWLITVVVENIGGADVDVDFSSGSDQTGLLFQDAFADSLLDDKIVYENVSSFASGDTTLSAGETDSLFFQISYIDPSAPDSVRILSRLRYIEINRKRTSTELTDDPNVIGGVIVESPPSIVYVDNSLKPSFVSNNTFVKFQVDVRNEGESTLILNPEETVFSFQNAPFATTLDRFLTTEIPGDSTVTLYFNVKDIDDSFDEQSYTPEVFLTGVENGNPYEQGLGFGDDQVTVGEPSELVIQSVEPSSATVTVGQTKPWTVDITVRNNGNTGLALDSARVDFLYFQTDISQLFVQSPPDSFLDGTSILPGNTTKTLRVQILSVDEQTPLESILLQANVWMTDQIQTTRQVYAQTSVGTSGYITVQDRARFDILTVFSSQPTVTRGQGPDAPWSIAMAVQNSGGSALRVLPQSDQSQVNFEKGNQYFTVSPETDTLLLESQESDTVRFTVSGVDTASVLLGPCAIDVTLQAEEINSGELIQTSTLPGGEPARTEVVIQDSAVVRIDSLLADIPNAPMVNPGQVVELRAWVSNPGTGDSVERLVLDVYQLTSTGFALVNGDSIEVQNIAAGESRESDSGVAVRAPAIANGDQATFAVRVRRAIARNTGGTARIDTVTAAGDTTVSLQVQPFGEIRFDSLYTESDRPITVSSDQPWSIVAIVSNIGGSPLRLDPLDSDDIRFLRDGTDVSTGYQWNAPTLDAEGRLLESGETDTLVYTVTLTGPVGGDITLVADISLNDINDLQRDIEPVQRTITIPVETNAAVRLLDTSIDPQRFEVNNDTGYVNLRQQFDVSVSIANQGGKRLDSVWVELTSDRSEVQQDTVVATQFAFGEQKTLNVSVTADSVENLDPGEQLVARIVKAIGSDGSEARITPARDSVAVIKIFNPADFWVMETVIASPNPPFVSHGQKFPVEMVVANRGSESIRDIRVRLQSTPTNLLSTPDTVFTLPTQLAGQDTQTVRLELQAGFTSGTTDIRSGIVDAIGANTGETLVPQLEENADSTAAVIQASATFQIIEVIPSESEVSAGDVLNDWRINVRVQNTGEADLEFIDIGQDDIVFVAQNGEVDEDYDVRPPLELQGADGRGAATGFTLPGGEIDTLVYVVSENGKIAGETEIRVDLKAIDKNLTDPPEQRKTAIASIFVKNRAWVRVRDLKLYTPVTGVDERSLANKGQTFELAVTLETGELAGVEDVRAEISSNGNSLSVNPVSLEIDSIASGQTVERRLNITADESWSSPDNEIIETFTGQILSAQAQGSSLDAQIRQALNNQAEIRLQEPARLDVGVSVADSVFPVNHEFSLTATITNLGTAPTGEGRIRLMPPDGYLVKNEAEEWVGQSVDKAFGLADGQESVQIPFEVQTPPEESRFDTLTIELAEMPADLNSGEPAAAASGRAIHVVSSVATSLSIDSTVIISPEGAVDKVLSTRQSFTIETQFEATGNLQSLTAHLTLPPGLGYELLQDRGITMDDFSGTAQWVIRSPESAVADSHPIPVEIVATDAEGERTHSDTLWIDQVQSRANLFLDDLTVSQPTEVMQDDKAIFTRGQTATLQTRILNLGEADVEGSGTVRLELLDSGLSPLNTLDELEKTFTVDQVIEWNIRAPQENTIDRFVRISIVERPVDMNTGLQADMTNSPNILDVTTQDQGQISIDNVYISSPVGAKDDTLSTGQTFEVSAEISSDERVRDNLAARIQFSSDDFIAPVRETDVAIGSGSIVTWSVQAPEVPHLTSDNIQITVTGYDKRSGQKIEVQSQPPLQVWVLQRALFSMEPALVWPEGITDQVSTDQEFHLAVKIRHEGAPYRTNEQFQIQLEKPVEYELLGDNTILTRQDTIITWHLKAPFERPGGLSKFLFRMLSWPRDTNSGEPAEVRNTEVSFSVQTMEKARAHLEAYLDEETQSQEGTIRVGSRFQVTAVLNNSGEAGMVGNYRARLILPPGNRFTTSEPLSKVQSARLHPSVAWTVNAPLELLEDPDTLMVVLENPPLDEYSRATVAVEKDTARVMVSTETGMLLVSTYSVRDGSTVIYGEAGQSLMGLQLKNRDMGTGTMTLLRGLLLTFLDKKNQPLAASSVVSRIAAVRHEPPRTVIGEMTTIPNRRHVTLDFSAQPDTVTGPDIHQIDIVADLIEPQSEIAFQVVIDSATAIDAIDATSGYPVLIGDENGNPIEALNLRSSTTVLVQRSLDESFFNYPNPFGSTSYPETQFVYVLEEPSDVQIKIFTLTGDLVWEKSFTQDVDAEQTRAGLHEGDITWDGRNGRGQRVRNGVYVAYLIVKESGESTTTKIAVTR